MNKFVFIKELKSNTTKNGTPYPVVTDQDNDTWHIFNKGANLELNKAYVFSFNFNDKGFKDIDKITPVVNIWKQEALKEISSRNDIIRNYSYAVTQAIQYFIAAQSKPDLASVLSYAKDIYADINNVADKAMAEINKPIDKGI